MKPKTLKRADFCAINHGGEVLEGKVGHAQRILLPLVKQETEGTQLHVILVLSARFSKQQVLNGYLQPLGRLGFRVDRHAQLQLFDLECRVQLGENFVQHGCKVCRKSQRAARFFAGVK